MKISKQTQKCFLEAVENAAFAAYPFVGKHRKNDADQATVNAIDSILNRLPDKAKIVIGEGEKDKAPMLNIGTFYGQGDTHTIDIAVDPLECTTQCARGEKGSFSTIAIAGAGCILDVPGAYYMDKIVTNENAKVSFKHKIKDNLKSIASSLDLKISDLRISVMNRPRNKALIKKLHFYGVGKVILVDGGCIEQSIISALLFGRSRVHAYMGIGGGPETILAAAAVKNLGGQVVAKLDFSEYDKSTGECIPCLDKRQNAIESGIDVDREYHTEDLVQGNSMLFVSGITSSSLAKGVKNNEHEQKLVSSIIISKHFQKNYRKYKCMF
jgi:fructose-1,6-bisphosphatase/sedoheptulose 1,7-bisphosphatase-like protein